MRRTKESKELEEPHKHEGFLLFTCFLAAAILGYFLTHYFALFGA
ncbi:MAG: hypothetical protein N3E52_02360 [Candidatus Bathyarchaeota archaeon]|nr:hypothetical protein [Candidatus Bathyarchaeota archaeon]